jgi:hypothetical protein
MTMELSSPTYSNVKLVFEREFDDRAAAEAKSRGYLSHISVRVNGGDLFPVFFYDPVRLAQDLEEETKLGEPFLADPAMIVVPDVTIENMFKAASKLADRGFFEYFRYPKRATKNPFEWPP